MFKMIFNTLIGLFLVMLIAGRDDGVPADKQAALEPEVTMAASAPLSIVDIAKIDTAQSDPVPEAIITPVVQVRMPGPALRPSPEHRVAAPAPTVTGGQLWEVSTNRLNVRAGPSTSNGVVDKIARGEQVLVISDASAEWVKIRIEGDGIEGWVAKRLLRPAN